MGNKIFKVFAKFVIFINPNYLRVCSTLWRQKLLVEKIIAFPELICTGWQHIAEILWINTKFIGPSLSGI